MTIYAPPTATLSHLHRTDGSATFSQNGYSIISSVNGPVEVQRRDELPEEASIDVVIRPAAGVGGTRERHLESILQATLRHIILVQNFPRTLIQVTLQITSTPESQTSSSKLNQASANLPILPSLIQAATLALLSATIPLSMTVAATILALKEGNLIIENPTLEDIEHATSVHVLGFTSQGSLLVNESEGKFSFEEWSSIHDHAKKICCLPKPASIEDEMQSMETDMADGNITQLYKTTMSEKLAQDLHWKA